MFNTILTWVQAHLLYFLFQAVEVAENGLTTLLSGSELDLQYLHRYNREFWSLLQIEQNVGPYHGTMVASMSMVPGVTYLPPTGRFEAWLEGLAFHPLMHLCYVVCICTLLGLMMSSSERRFGLYAKLSLTVSNVTKLIKIFPTSMMIDFTMWVMSLASPKIIYDIVIMAADNFRLAYTPTNSHPWLQHLSPPSAASSFVPNSFTPIILAMILSLMILYLQDLQAVTTSQRAEIQLLEEKLKASEWDNKQLRKANADLRDSIKEKDLTITELKETKVNDNDTIAHVRRLLEQACDRIKEMVNTKTDLRGQIDDLKNDKKALETRVAAVEQSNDLKSQRISTLGKEATEKDKKIEALQATTAATTPPSTKPAPSTPSRNPPPTESLINAWANFAVDDAQNQDKLRREAAIRAAEDAKNGINRDPVEPVLATNFKQVTIGPNGERIVKKAVKDGPDTTGTAVSGADAEVSGSVPSSGPAPGTPPSSSTTPKTPTPARERCSEFFKKGHCRFGDSCSFKHDNSGKREVDSPTNRLCRFFQAGYCQYGDRCNYAHIITDETVGGTGTNRSGKRGQKNKQRK